jgi:hypothetical protein
MTEPLWIINRSSSSKRPDGRSIRRRRLGSFEFIAILVLAVASLSHLPATSAFSMSSSSSASSSKQPSIPENGGGGKRRTNNKQGELYGIPNSGWTSPQWNWGYARGTGHDCAAICRNRYATRASRETLVQQLLVVQDQAQEPLPTTTTTMNIEEVKLVLALAWQNGRWDGSDGGRGGYGDVLTYMAQAERYEPKHTSIIQEQVEHEQNACYRRLIEDMQMRFYLLNPTPQQLETMKALLEDTDDNDKEKQADVGAALCRCCGLVLSAMRFVDNGL